MSSGYPATVPFSLEKIFEVFQSQVIAPCVATGMPAKSLAEESFWAGAESFLSIMIRAKSLGATPEEGAAIITRCIEEIGKRAAEQDSRIKAAFDGSPD